MTWRAYVVGSIGMSNHSVKVDAMRHALNWLRSAELGQPLVVSDNVYALQDAQAQRRCAAKVKLVHRVRAR